MLRPVRQTTLDKRDMKPLERSGMVSLLIPHWRAHQKITAVRRPGGRYLTANTEPTLAMAYSTQCVRQLMDDSNNKPPTFLQMLHSVLRSGVQSGKNRARDFTHGKPSHFVILGILSTVVFALTLVFGIVKLVLHLAGV